jgi:multiple sugar transport system substrate-binding protein
MPEPDPKRTMTRRRALQWGASAALLGLASPVLAACGGGGSGSGSASGGGGGGGKLVLWTYFDQVKIAAQEFMKKHPGISVDVKVYPGSDYETKMRLALQTDQSAPDLFDLDVDYLGKYVNGPFPENLSAMGAGDLVKDYVPYVSALGKDGKGDVRAVADTSSPGGLWFRRDVAKQYLGTDDPDQVSHMVSSWDGMIRAGRDVLKKSGGQVHILESYSIVVQDSRHQMKPWVVGGKFNVDPAWNQVLDAARTMFQEGIDAKLGAFSPAWGSAWNNGSVIMFGWPSWASTFIDPTKTGDTWGIAKGPVSYYEGGRYTAIYSKSGNKQLAYRYIQFLAGRDWQLTNLQKTQNMPGLRTVYQDQGNSYKPSLFAGQPIMKTYQPIAMGVPARPADSLTETIQSLFYPVVSNGFKTGKSNQEIFDGLKQQVRSQLPDVKVD